MSNSLALLRGINVGGNTLIKMSELREALEADGFEDVRTYINSGNVIFKTGKGNAAPQIGKVITKHFGHAVDVVCFTDKRWTAIIDAAPSWWGEDDKFRHNLFALLKADEIGDVIDGLGELRPGMEMLEAGDGVLYQSVEIASIGKAATGSKSASKAVYKRMTVRNYNTSKAVYKRMTVRNYNTSVKLATLLGSAE